MTERVHSHVFGVDVVVTQSKTINREVCRVTSGFYSVYPGLDNFDSCVQRLVQFGLDSFSYCIFNTRKSLWIHAGCVEYVSDRTTVGSVSWCCIYVSLRSGIQLMRIERTLKGFNCSW